MKCLMFSPKFQIPYLDEPVEHSLIRLCMSYFFTWFRIEVCVVGRKYTTLCDAPLILSNLLVCLYYSSGTMHIHWLRKELKNIHNFSVKSLDYKRIKHAKEGHEWWDKLSVLNWHEYQLEIRKCRFLWLIVLRFICSLNLYMNDSDWVKWYRTCLLNLKINMTKFSHEKLSPAVQAAE